MADEYAIQSGAVRQLTKLVEESTRATSESVKYFVEPTPGVLDKAKNKRHHIIFGRRGSGKSSLLHKVASDLTVSRTPIAYVDLEQFKGHSYPDVLISVLMSTLTEFKKWLDTAATNPASKTSFWKKLFGSTPTKGAFSKRETEKLSNQFAAMIDELSALLFQADEQKNRDSKNTDASIAAKLGSELESSGLPMKASVKANVNTKIGQSAEHQSEYISNKIEALHRNILRYKHLFENLSALANGPSFLLLDDLYHLRLSDQAQVLDYFFRIAKGANLWLKVGTIRHRSRWYVRGNPSIGMKLGDDADEIDLDATLEKYDLTKNFLFRILPQLARDVNVKLEDILIDGGKDRLVLTSGGVARDFLSIFRRSVDVVLERIIRGELARGARVGVEDVNIAAGDQGQFKEEDFSRDTSPEDQDRLTKILDGIIDFCVAKIHANCFLVEKDIPGEIPNAINELVDLKFLHRAKSRVTVRDRSGRLYDAYMLDISRYVGERTRRGVKLVKFWGKGSDDALRKTNLIYLEKQPVAAYSQACG
jgi:Cdc6-like AAA superfamily ATPase